MPQAVFYVNVVFLAAYSIVAPDAIFGAVERVFINAPHAIRKRAGGLRTIREADARNGGDLDVEARRVHTQKARARRQPSTLLKFTGNHHDCIATPSPLFTDSVEKAAESPVQNSKERAKCGLPTALHNSVGGLPQLLHPLYLAEIGHILSSGFCAVAQDSLHFPHALLTFDRGFDCRNQDVATHANVWTYGRARLQRIALRSHRGRAAVSR
jgi:hypothetical protein